MKKLSVPAMALIGLAITATAQIPKATIKIDLEREIGDIDSMIYGSFTEHLGRCIYGGIYDPNSPKANPDGFRSDVIAATQALGVSIIRWPGGNFSSGYHWMDGIGPKPTRPRRLDLAWGDIESNQVGTDEFLRFAKTTGVQAYICANLGTGTWDEAKNWVEYCNSKVGLYYSDLRAKNGHPEPYQVKYWGLGNEMDGPWQMGHRNAEDYSKFALEAAKLMKWSDPSIKLIASGSSDYGADWVHWNRTVLTSLRDQIDYISLHHYAGNNKMDHYQFMASTLQVEEIIAVTEALIKEVHVQFKTQQPIYIAFDEYNVWYRTSSEQKLEEHYNLQDALVISMYLNCFLRHANVVKMANLAQLVNVIAPMMVTGDTLWKQTIYYPLQLFATYCHGHSLEAFVQSDSYSLSDRPPIPFLDVSAVHNETAKELIITVVNRHLDKAVQTNIINQFGHWNGKAVVMEINGKELTQENSPSRTNVTVAQREIHFNGDQFDYSFPPHSITMVRIQLGS